MKIGGAWRISRTDLRLTYDDGEYAARTLVPPEVTRKAQGHITARAELPEVGIGYFSQQLRVGPRVAVRTVKFLEKTQDRVLSEAPSGRTVRIQAQIDVWPKEGLPEGERAVVRLYRREAFEQPADLKTGTVPQWPIAEFKTTVKGPPGRQGVEVLWDAALERVMKNGAQQSRRLLGCQWIHDERARRQGTPPKGYLGAQLMAEVEVWGASGRTTDEGSRGGSGWLKILDDVDVQVVLGAAEGESEALLSQAKPLSEAKVEIKLPDGTKRTGRLRKDGRVVLRNVPPGRCFLRLPGLRERPPTARSDDSESDSQKADPERTDIRARLTPGGPDPEVELVTGVPTCICLEARLPEHSA